MPSRTKLIINETKIIKDLRKELNNIKEIASGWIKWKTARLR